MKPRARSGGRGAGRRRFLVVPLTTAISIPPESCSTRREARHPRSVAHRGPVPVEDDRLEAAREFTQRARSPLHGLRFTTSTLPARGSRAPARTAASDLPRSDCPDDRRTRNAGARQINAERPHDELPSAWTHHLSESRVEQSIQRGDNLLCGAFKTFRLVSAGDSDDVHPRSVAGGNARLTVRDGDGALRGARQGERRPRGADRVRGENGAPRRASPEPLRNRRRASPSLRAPASRTCARWRRSRFA